MHDNKTLNQAKAPMWRRTMLQNLDLNTIIENLDEIGEAGNYYGYHDSSMGEYYEEYRELFNELSMGACDLSEAISQIGEYDGESYAGWDDCTVALLGGVKKVLGYDSGEMDYFSMLSWDEELGINEAEKRLMRLTKAQLIRLFRTVLVTLVAYMDIKGSFDTLSAVVNELDSRAASMQNGQMSQQMWVE